jgi:hypothetical protein
MLAASTMEGNFSASGVKQVVDWYLLGGALFILIPLLSGGCILGQQPPVTSHGARCEIM